MSLAKALRNAGFAVNAINHDRIATDLDDHAGPGSVEQAAASVTQLAMSELALAR